MERTFINHPISIDLSSFSLPWTSPQQRMKLGKEITFANFIFGKQSSLCSFLCRYVLSFRGARNRCTFLFVPSPRIAWVRGVCHHVLAHPTLPFHAPSIRPRLQTFPLPPFRRHQHPDPHMTLSLLCRIWVEESRKRLMEKLQVSWKKPQKNPKTNERHIRRTVEGQNNGARLSSFPTFLGRRALRNHYRFAPSLLTGLC